VNPKDFKGAILQPAPAYTPKEHVQVAADAGMKAQIAATKAKMNNFMIKEQKNGN